jgi:hypothetical protein
MNTHFALIVSSGRIVPVVRCGRLLLILRPRHGRGYDSVATCRYDSRFKLLRKGFRP